MTASERPMDSKKVWTAVITNLDYLPGLLTLNHSLRCAFSAYPLVALYTPTFPERGLAALRARAIPALPVPHLRPLSGGRDYANDPRFHDCWTKLVPFSLVQFSRVVQLDADMLVLRNMDELMELPLDGDDDAAAAAAAAPLKCEDDAIENTNGTVNGTGIRVFAAGHACVCNPLGKPHYPPDWIPSNCAFTTQHATPLDAQTQAPLPSASPLGFINGGLQVVNPSAALYAQILASMDAGAADMEFADQSLLSTLYKGRWVALPYVYNALKTMRWEGVHDAIWRDDQVKNVHYILSPKPWDEIDEKGKWTGTDESHRWWIDMNRQRRVWELDHDIPDDGF